MYGSKLLSCSLTGDVILADGNMSLWLIADLEEPEQKETNSRMLNELEGCLRDLIKNTRSYNSSCIMRGNRFSESSLTL